MAAIKLIVFGDVSGDYQQLFGKLQQLHEKSGPFALALCVGRFNSPKLNENEGSFDDLKAGRIKVAVPTYFIGFAPEQEELKEIPDGGPICENLFYLGRAGIKTIKGLRIAFVSGLAQPCTGVTPSSEIQNSTIDQVLRKSTGIDGVDILLTNQWPEGICNHVNIPERVPQQSSLISRLAKYLKPRYHFSSSYSNTNVHSVVLSSELEKGGIFFERNPYQNIDDFSIGPTKAFSTRFISLAKCFNKDKQKFMYAINTNSITQMSSEPNVKGLTRNPFNIDSTSLTTLFPDSVSSLERMGVFVKTSTQGSEVQRIHTVNDKDVKSSEKETQPIQTTTTQVDGLLPTPSDDLTLRFGSFRNSQNQNRNLKRKREPSIRDQSCWFCLSNAQAETHLLISIGEKNYLALAKGALNENHVLIIPIEHTQSMVKADDETFEEALHFLGAIEKCFKTFNHRCVAFERFVPTNKILHTQMQVVAIPSVISTADVIELITKEVEKNESSLIEVTKEKSIQEAIGDSPYFLFVFDDRRFVSLGERFPFHLGRQICCGLLNHPGVDWRTCVVAKEEETRMTDNFKAKFAEFDFTVFE